MKEKTDEITWVGRPAKMGRARVITIPRRLHDKLPDGYSYTITVRRVEGAV